MFLVLNRFYMPIRVVNVRRALTLLYRECAEVIGTEEGTYVSYDFESWCGLSQLTSLEKQPGEESTFKRFILSCKFRELFV